MKRNSKLIYCKRETSLREKNHDKKNRHSPGREKPTNGELSAVHRDVYTHLWSIVLSDDLVICRWFLYTAKAWNLSIAIPDIKLCCFKILQVKEQTQDREESSDDGDDKKPVEKFELVTVLVGKAGFQRNHLYKSHI